MHVAVDNVATKIARVYVHYNLQIPIIDYNDDLSIAFPDCRSNLRSSNTDPLLRFDIESKSNIRNVKYKTEWTESLIAGEND